MTPTSPAIAVKPPWHTALIHHAFRKASSITPYRPSQPPRVQILPGVLDSYDLHPRRALTTLSLHTRLFDTFARNPARPPCRRDGAHELDHDTHWGRSYDDRAPTVQPDREGPDGDRVYSSGVLARGSSKWVIHCFLWGFLLCFSGSVPFSKSSSASSDRSREW